MVNLTYSKNRILPTAEELPSSDETPVDNQLQNDIPNLLLSLLLHVRSFSSGVRDLCLEWPEM